MLVWMLELGTTLANIRMMALSMVIPDNSQTCWFMSNIHLERDIRVKQQCCFPHSIFVSLEVHIEVKQTRG